MNTQEELARIAARVKAGAAHLDARDPGWWREDAPHPIDLARLDMASICDCVIGQRHGCYSPALDGVRPGAEAIALGFDRPNLTAPESGPAHYSALAAEWGRVISARRNQKEPAP